MKLQGDFRILWASYSSCLSLQALQKLQMALCELLTPSLYTNRKVFPSKRPRGSKGVGEITHFTWAQLLQPTHPLLQVFTNRRKQAGNWLPGSLAQPSTHSVVPISFLTGDKSIYSPDLSLSLLF